MDQGTLSSEPSFSIVRVARRPRSSVVRPALLAAVAVITLSSFGSVAADPDGVILDVDTVWTLAGSPYSFSQNVTVRNDATLRIDPGVVVSFAPGRHLQIGDPAFAAPGGRLLASGTSLLPIRIEGAGVALAVASPVGPSQLSFVQFPSAPEWAIEVASAGAVLQDLSVTDPGAGGVRLDGASPRIARSTFDGGPYAVFAEDHESTPDLDANVFRDQTTRHLRVGLLTGLTGNTYEGTGEAVELLYDYGALDEDLTLPDLGVAIDLLQGFTVRNDATLTLAPGLHLRGADNAGITIGEPGHTVVEGLRWRYGNYSVANTSVRFSPTGAPGTGCENPGPDGAGYVCGEVPFVWQDISATGTLFEFGWEDVSRALPVGFDFGWYGRDYDDVHISENGFVTFTWDYYDWDDGCCSGQAIPDAYGPNDLIAAYWERLNPYAAGATIHYGTFGAAPNREFVVQFTDVPHQYSSYDCTNGGQCTTPKITFQIALLEGSDAAEIRLRSAPSDGGTHVTGIESFDNALNPYAARGRLLAEGTPEAPILLESLDATPGARWRGIAFDGWEGSVAPSAVRHATFRAAENDLLSIWDTSDVVVDHVRFEDPGNAGIDLYMSSASISNATFLGGERGVDGYGLEPTIVDSTFENQTTRWATLPILGDYARNTFLGNGTAIEVGAGDWVEEDVVWPPVAGVPNELGDWTGFRAGATFTIPPGTTITAAPWSRLEFGDGYEFTTTGRTALLTEGSVTESSWRFAPGASGPGCVDAGLDVGGYGCASMPFTWTDISAGGTPLDIYEDDFEWVNLPFPFTYYGTEFNEVYVGDNGLLDFEGNWETGCCEATALPTPNEWMYSVVAAWWEDLDTEAGGTVDWLGRGTAPNREFVVQWTDVPHRYTGAPSTFQIVLHESGAIDVHVLNGASDGGLHGIGIESPPRYTGSATLIAEGTEAAPIVIESASGDVANGWNGLYFEGWNDVAVPVALRNVTLRNVRGTGLYATGWNDLVLDRLTVDGAGSYGVYLSTADATLTDCMLARGATADLYVYSSAATVRNCEFVEGGRGVWSSYAQPGLSIEGSTFTNQTTRWARVPLNSGLDEFVDRNTFVGAGTAIELSSGAYSTTYLAEPVLIPERGIPFDLAESIVARNAATVEIEPGVTIRGATNAYLQIGDPNAYTVYGRRFDYGNFSRSETSVLFSQSAPSAGCDHAGADLGGYTCAVVPFTFTDIAATGDPLAVSTNVLSAPVPIGFPVTHYGATYDEVYVHENGFLTFLPGSSYACCTGQALPTTSEPQTVIAAYWDDFDLAVGGSVRTATLGEAPNRQFIVQWTAVPHTVDSWYCQNYRRDCGGHASTFQIVLAEGSTDVLVNLLAADSDGSTHSTGIESHIIRFGSARFVAEGTAAEPIVLESLSGATATGWGGLRFRGSAESAADSLLRNVTLRNVSTHAIDASSWSADLLLDRVTIDGAATRGIFLTGSDAEIRGCTVRNATVGLYLSTSAPIVDGCLFAGGQRGVEAASWESQAVIRDSTFRDQTVRWARVAVAPGLPDFLDGNVFEGTGTAIELLGGSRYHSASVVIPDRGVPYDLVDWFGVQAGAELTIDPGVEIRGETNAYIAVGNPSNLATYGVRYRYGSFSAANTNVRFGPGVTGSGCELPGPDALGYACAVGPWSWTDIATTGTSAGVQCDDCMSGAVSLGFPFTYYGRTYSSAYISSNGFLSFLSGQSSGCCSGQFLPTAGSPDAVIAGYWEDFYPPGLAGGAVVYQTIGTAPNRDFVVQWNNVAHYCCSAYPVTFQIVLHENSTTFDVKLKNVVTDGGSHVTGIESHTVPFTPGRLVAEGTEAEPIVLSSLRSQSSGWGGLRFLGAGGAATQSTLRNVTLRDTIPCANYNTYAHCNWYPRQAAIDVESWDLLTLDRVTIERPGSHAIDLATSSPTITDCVVDSPGTSGIALSSSSPTIRGCEFRNGQRAIDATSVASTPTIVDNVFRNQSVRWARVGLPSVLADNDFLENGTAVELWGGNTWHAGNLTITADAPRYDLAQWAGFRRDGSLTIEPGVVVKPASDSYFLIGDPNHYVTHGVRYASGSYSAPQTSVRFGPGVAGTGCAAAGPDLAGYGCAVVPYAFTDIATTGTAVGPGNNGVTGAVAIGFPFTFYGVERASVYLAENGFLAFSSGQGGGCCSGQTLPDANGPNDIVAAYWEDLYLAGGGSVRHQTLGTAPERTFIAQWTGVPHWSSGNLVTAQIVLYEGSNLIDVNLLAAPSDGGSHATGVESFAINFGKARLLAEGTAAAPITIESLSGSATNGWQGIVLQGANGAADASVLRNVTLRNSFQENLEVQAYPDVAISDLTAEGARLANVYFNAASPTLDGCRLANGQAQGLYLVSSSPVVRGCEIVGGTRGIEGSAWDSRPTVVASTFRDQTTRWAKWGLGSTFDAATTFAGTGTAVELVAGNRWYDEDLRIRAGPAAYDLANWAGIRSGHTLTIDPGVTVRGAADAYFDIGDETLYTTNGLRYASGSYSATATSIRFGTSVTGTGCQTPGPDAGGYRCAVVPYAFTDIRATATPVSIGGNALTGALPIGFAFPFYGTTYTQVYAAENGYLTFDVNAGGGCCSGQTLPDRNGPNAIIAAYWEDLRMDTGGTGHYQTFGAAPNRTFVFQYTGVPHWSSGNLFTGQVVLFENSTDVQINLQAAPSDGGAHATGIEGPLVPLGAGRIVVRGTEAAPIVLDSLSGSGTNGWQGLRFDGRNGAAAPSELRNVTLRFARDRAIQLETWNDIVLDRVTVDRPTGYGIVLYRSSPTITGCVVTNAPTNDVWLEGGSSPTLDGCVLTGSQRAIWSTDWTARPTVRDTRFVNQTTRWARVGAASVLEGNVYQGTGTAVELLGGNTWYDTDITWPGPATYDLFNWVGMRGGATLTVEPGVTVRGASDAYLNVGDTNAWTTPGVRWKSGSYSETAKAVRFSTSATGFGCVTPGPDAGGYGCGAIPFSWTNISATGSPIHVANDQISSAVPIGFPFTFYGQAYTEAFVGDNGFLTFTPGQSNGCCSGQALPDRNAPNNLVAGYWEDLNPATGSIRYQTVGDAPNRALIVQWTSLAHCCSVTTARATFQVILREGSNDAEVHLERVTTDGGTHVTGLEGPVSYAGRGDVRILGTAAQPVLFDSQSGSITNGWQGIRLFGANGADGETVIRNATLRFARDRAIGDDDYYGLTLDNVTIDRAQTYGVVLTRADADIRGCTILSPSLYGLYMAGSNPTIRDCTFVGAQRGVWATDWSSRPTITDSTFRNQTVRWARVGFASDLARNTYEGTGTAIELLGGNTWIDTDVTIRDEAPYEWYNWVGMRAGSTVRIEPGVEMKAASDAFFNVGHTDNWATSATRYRYGSFAEQNLSVRFSRVAGGYGCNMPGPDSGGYLCSVVPWSWTNISQTGTLLPLANDATSTPIPIGFPFEFYGTLHSNAFVADNGFVTFTSGQSGGGGQNLPDRNGPNNLIAGFWEDLYVPGGTVRYQTVGIAPFREFIVQWTNVPHKGGTPADAANRVTFQIVLKEFSNEVEVRLETARTDGGNHVVGLESPPIYSTAGQILALGTASDPIRLESLTPATSGNWWQGFRFNGANFAETASVVRNTTVKNARDRAFGVDAWSALTLDNVTVDTPQTYGFIHNVGAPLVKESTFIGGTHGFWAGTSGAPRIRGSTFLGQTQYGIRLENQAGYEIVGNTLRTTSAATGVWLNNGDNGLVASNSIRGSAVGLNVASSSASNLVYDNVFRNTRNSVDASTTTRYNITPVEVANACGGPWSGGNCWADYGGVDNTGDGIGDTALAYRANITGAGDRAPLLAFPHAEFAYLIQNSTAAIMAFTDQTSAPLWNIVNWTWDFGDGNFSYVQHPVHDFENERFYNVTLTIVDERGLTSTVTHSFLLDTIAPVTAGFLDGLDGNAGWFRSEVEATLSATDGNEVVALVYRLDGLGDWLVYGQPLRFTREGVTRLEYYAYDVAGNNEIVHVVDVKIDSVAPTSTTVLTGTQHATGWYTTAVNAAVAGQDATSGVAFVFSQLDGGDVRTIPNVPIATTGVHSLVVFPEDVAGNVGSLVTTSIPVDVSIPVSAVDVAGTAGTNGWWTSPVTVSTAASDAGAGVALLQTAIDGAPLAPYAGPSQLSADGIHTVAHQASDLVDHLETLKTDLVKIDQTLPTLTAVVTGTQHPSGWYITAPRLWANASDATSGVYRIEYQLDTNPWTTMTGPVTFNTDGNHALNVRATDFAGNVVYFPAISLPIDLRAPTTTPAFTGPVGPLGSAGGWWRGDVSVALTPSDGLGSGVVGLGYSLDGGVLVPYAGAIPVTGEGRHTLNFSATDLVGWVESLKTRAVNIDTTRPSVGYAVTGLQDANGTYVGPVRVTMTGADSLAGIHELQYSLNGGNSWQRYNGPLNWATSTVVSLQFRAVDLAGNLALPQFLNFTLEYDVTPPTTSLTLSGLSTSPPWYRGEVSVTMVAVDLAAGVDLIRFSLDDQPFQSYNGTIRISPEGVHTLRYQALDLLGNVEALKTATIRIDATPPAGTETVTGPLGLDGWFVGPATVTLATSDLTSGPGQARYRIDGDALQLYSGPFVIGTSGAHVVDWTAVDLAGNTQSRRFHVNVDMDLPVVDLLADGPAGNASWFKGVVNISLDASDPTSGILGVFYRFDVNGTWLPFVENLTLDAEGRHRLQYYAVDKSGLPGLVYEHWILIDLTTPIVGVRLENTLAVEFRGHLYVSGTVCIEVTGLDALSLIEDAYLIVAGSVRTLVRLNLAVEVHCVEMEDGPWEIGVLGCDYARNCIFRGFPIRVDNLAPYVQILRPFPGALNVQDMSIPSFRLAFNNPDVHLQVDQGGLGEILPADNFTVSTKQEDLAKVTLVAGTRVPVWVRAWDFGGEVDRVELYVDGKRIGVSSEPQNVTWQRVVWDRDEDSFDPPTFWVENYTEPAYVFEIDTFGWTEGDHEFLARAFDVPGKIGSTLRFVGFVSPATAEAAISAADAALADREVEPPYPQLLKEQFPQAVNDTLPAKVEVELPSDVRNETDEASRIGHVFARLWDDLWILNYGFLDQSTVRHFRVYETADETLAASPVARPDVVFTDLSGEPNWWHPDPWRIIPPEDPGPQDPPDLDDLDPGPVDPPGVDDLDPGPLDPPGLEDLDPGPLDVPDVPPTGAAAASPAPAAAEAAPEAPRGLAASVAAALGRLLDLLVSLLRLLEVVV